MFYQGLVMGMVIGFFVGILTMTWIMSNEK
jgi:hypothetical protein